MNKLVIIVIYIICGLLSIYSGVLLLLDPGGYALFFIVVYHIPIDYEILVKIISIGGIIFLVIGIIFLVPVTIKIALTKKKKHEEKQDYMNPSWLRHHYHELGWTLQDIANE